jgi:hypothetical protein
MFYGKIRTGEEKKGDLKSMHEFCKGILETKHTTHITHSQKVTVVIT